MRPFGASWVILVALAGAGLARGAEPFRYPEAKFGQGELRYFGSVPVLTVQGSPEEVGAQL